MGYLNSSVFSSSIAMILIATVTFSLMSLATAACPPGNRIPPQYMCQCTGTPVSCSVVLRPTKKPTTTTTTTTTPTPNPTCDCDYFPRVTTNIKLDILNALFAGGGCKVSKSAPNNLACKCSYKGGFTCGGTPVACTNPGRCNSPVYIDGVSGLEYCLQGGGDCNGAGVQSYERGDTTCDCDYHSNGIFSSGGCKISTPPRQGYACKCKYLGAWTCGGTMQLCADVNSSFCKNPDSSKDTCNQGGGDCGGY